VPRSLKDPINISRLFPNIDSRAKAVPHVHAILCKYLEGNDWKKYVEQHSSRSQPAEEEVVAFNKKYRATPKEAVTCLVFTGATANYHFLGDSLQERRIKSGERYEAVPLVS